MPAIDKHIFPSVHKGIVRAALMVLDMEQPETALHYTSTDRDILIDHAADPDLPGDRNQGRGLHYYNAVNPYGRLQPLHPVMQGYCNGLNRPAPSPLSVLDSEYRTALALFHTRRRTIAMDSLTRALHMLADICCPPHTCSLTYFSLYAKAHKRYEARAAEMFWHHKEDELCARAWAVRACGRVPYSAYTDLLRTADLDCRDHAESGYTPGKFAELCNGLARSGGMELPVVIGNDEAARDRSIEKRLTLSIAHCAALLAAFARDSKDSTLPVWRENTPYWLCTVLERETVTKSPLFLHFQHDGTCMLATQSGMYLSASLLRGIRFINPETDTITRNLAFTRFRFSMEPLLTLIPDGDRQQQIVYGYDVFRKKWTLTMLNRNSLSNPRNLPRNYAGLLLRTEMPQKTEFLFPL